jgi:DNA-binding MarR family transcriptional regulator
MTDTRGPMRAGTNFQDKFPDARARAAECVFNLILIGNLLDARLADFMRGYRLSTAAANILAIVAGAGEPLSPYLISERRFVTRGATTSVLDSLEKRGLIRRVPHPSDRRMLLIEVTDAATSFVDEAEPHVHRLETAWMACLTAEEQDALVAILGKIHNHLAALSPTEPAIPKRLSE